MPTDTAGLSDEQRARDIAAGDAFRKTLLLRADATQGGAPMFYGWAIMEAYLAGLRDGRGARVRD